MQASGAPSADRPPWVSSVSGLARGWCELGGEGAWRVYLTVQVPDVFSLLPSTVLISVVLAALAKENPLALLPLLLPCLLGLSYLTCRVWPGAKPLREGHCYVMPLPSAIGHLTPTASFAGFIPADPESRPGDGAVRAAGWEGWKRSEK